MMKNTPHEKTLSGHPGQVRPTSDAKAFAQKGVPENKAQAILQGRILAAIWCCQNQVESVIRREKEGAFQVTTEEEVKTLFAREVIRACQQVEKDYRESVPETGTEWP